MFRRFRAPFACLIAVALVLAAAGPAAADTNADVRAVQAFLDSQGYDAGTPDGLMGSRTRGAIEAYEKDHGRTPTGQLSGWLVGLATAGDNGAAATASGGAGATTTTTLSTSVPTDAAAANSVSTLKGDPTALAGTGALSFSTRDDGSLLITDGLPWRAGVSVAPRTLTIVKTQFDLFTASADSKVPVPLDNQVVDVPGTTFVPVFLASDRAAAVKGSLADAVGVTWRFQQGGLSFDAGGYVLTAAKPGATLAFTKDGVVARGFKIEKK